MSDFIRFLLRREDAATSVEYGLLLSVVFCVAMSSIGLFGPQLSQLIDRVNTVWESDSLSANFDDSSSDDSSSSDNNSCGDKGKHNGHYKGNSGGKGKGNANGQSDGKGNNG